MNNWHPYFIGIGAMRCATTWISRCIEQHPELYIPKGIKEIHFFDKANAKDINGKFRWNFEKGLEWYESYFKKAKGHQKVGEITPNYLSDKQTPQLIHKNFPDTKLILSLRHPIRRCFSHYQFVRKNHSNIPEKFSEAIQDHNLNFRFMELGLYGQYLQNYLKYFPMDQILILFYDEISSDPIAVCKKIYSFLDVSSDFEPSMLNNKINTSGEIKSKIVHKLIRKSKQRIKTMHPVRNIIESIGGVKIVRWLNRKNTVKNTNSVHSIDLNTITFLNEYYKNDIELLESLMNIDLCKWKKI